MSSLIKYSIVNNVTENIYSFLAFKIVCELIIKTLDLYRFYLKIVIL